VVVGRRSGFGVIFAPEVVEHLRAVERKHHGLIRRQIRARLAFEPDREGRNRKPLDVPSPYGAQWELRFGPGNRFRVFYEVDGDHRLVKVLAIGVKEGNRLRIGREEYSI
jgi:mRNA-degrading endonuclease RelE of RelBE toxin-antitoxin system